MKIDMDNVKPYENMSEWQRESALHSARYILEDLDMNKLSESSND